MKVICINNGFLLNQGGGKSEAPELEELQIYTVIGITETKGGYLLQEAKATGGTTGGFLMERFIPVSEIDEPQLKEERELTLTPTIN